MEHQSIAPSVHESGGQKWATSGLKRLLHLAGWRGTDSDIQSILIPHGPVSIESFCTLALASDLHASIVRDRLANLLQEIPLLLFERPNKHLVIVVPNSAGQPQCLDALDDTAVEMPALSERGRAVVLLRRDDPDQPKAAAGRRWVQYAKNSARHALAPVISLTIASNLLGLALPLFTLAIYDQVLASHNANLLPAFATGFLVAICADFALRILRGIIIARSASMVDFRSAVSLFSRLTRFASLSGGAIASRYGTMRLRDFDVISNFFASPLGFAFIELPFSIIYLVVMAILAGWLVIVPVFMLLVVGGALFIAFGWLAARIRHRLRRSDSYRQMCADVSQRLWSIKAEGHEAVWFSHFRAMSSRLAEAEMGRQKVMFAAQVAAHGLASLTVIATLGFGATLAIRGEIGVGALIASIVLVWRMMAPVAPLLMARVRWNDVKDTMADTRTLLEQVLDITGNGSLDESGCKLEGSIQIQSATVRYPNTKSAALYSMNLAVKAGTFVVVTGQTASGKSTLLDLVAGLVEPQFGNVTINGINPRHLSPSALRKTLGYVTCEPAQLPLTIKEFLCLGIPHLSFSEVHGTCVRLGVSDMIEVLPNGFDTELFEIEPASSLLKTLPLVRALLSNPKIILIDEPDASNVTARNTLLREIERIKGKSTIILATHEPQFIAKADCVVVLRDGVVLRTGNPTDLFAHTGSAQKNA